MTDVCEQTYLLIDVTLFTVCPSTSAETLTGYHIRECYDDKRKKKKKEGEEERKDEKEKEEEEEEEKKRRTDIELRVLKTQQVTRKYATRSTLCIQFERKISFSLRYL